MEGLDLGVILDDEQIDSLFSDESNTPLKEEEEKNDNETTQTAEVDPDNLFEDIPESVGSEEIKDNEEDTTPEKDGSSPDFFSSIANAFAEEGIFPDLEEETIKNIKTAEDFRKAIDEQIKAGLDEQQKRVAEALNNNVEPSKISQYENVISYLNSITEDTLTAEGEQGENLRKKILYQDYINRGFSQERATKAVDRAISNGTDIEDAKEALESNKAFFTDEYNQLLQDAKVEKEKEAQETKAKAERLKKTILEDDIKLFTDVELSKDVRKKAFDAISKPIYKDPKTGEVYTAIQKLELDNSEDFLTKLGIMYALTDGFTSIDNLVKTKVKKEVKKGFSDLEKKINNTKRDSRGNLVFASGVNDSESVIGKGIKLDI